MPRLKNSKPPQDFLKAIMLQRKKDMRMSSEELAKSIGVSRQTLTEMLKKSTEDWTLGQIKRACYALWITAEEMRSAIKM